MLERNNLWSPLRLSPLAFFMYVPREPQFLMQMRNTFKCVEMFKCLT